MNFTPVGDRIIVKRVEASKVSKGGIIIPDVAQEKMAEGKVVAIGYGRAQDDGSIRPMSVKVGDSVIFGKFNGTDIKVDGEDFLILHEEDIFGRFFTKEDLEKELAEAKERVAALEARIVEEASKLVNQQTSAA